MESLFQLVTGLMAPTLRHTHYVSPPSLTDCGGECSTTCPPYRSLGSHAVSGAAFKIPVVMCHTIADVLKNSFKSTSLAFDDPVIVGASLDNVNMETGQEYVHRECSLALACLVQQVRLVDCSKNALALQSAPFHTAH